MEGYLKYYDLEKYLFEDVHQKFHQHGFIAAFDFFCILEWKASRAKTYHVPRLEKIDNDLDIACEILTKSIYEIKGRKEKMRFLIEKHTFKLPTASAILSVLYPEDFTVYDIRVCNELKNFYSLDNLIFENRWNKYEEYINKVKEITDKSLSLRDKDRYLWGKSFKEQLEGNIRTNFSKEIK